MGILLAGTSGAIGRALVRRLRANSHEVLALTHSRDSTPALKDIGAELWHRPLQRSASEWADYVMETGPRRGRRLPEGAKVGDPLMRTRLSMFSTGKLRCKFAEARFAGLVPGRYFTNHLKTFKR